MMLDKVFLLLCSVVVMALGADGRSYHFVHANRSWAEARTHCQDCFTGLVFDAPERLKRDASSFSGSSVYWTDPGKTRASPGLNGTVNSSSDSWSNWAGGAPHPVQNWTSGDPVPDPTSRNDSEDSCVAMLDFEVWVETNCSEPLPFICYDDVFVGEINVTDITSSSATVTWPPASGLVNHYGVHLDDRFVQCTFTDRTVELVGLAPGTQYSVRVSVSKCRGHSFMQPATFHTIPGRVSNLTLTANHSCLRASWTPPEGGYSSFTADLLLDGETVETAPGLPDAAKTFAGLQGDARYTVKVRAVSGQQVGPAVSDSTFTPPSPPSDARAAANDTNTIAVEWTAPENFPRATYGVKASSVFWGHSRAATVFNRTNHTFYNLKSGSKYDFEVYAVGATGNSSSLHFSAYTAPKCQCKEKSAWP